MDSCQCYRYISWNYIFTKITVEQSKTLKVGDRVRFIGNDIYMVHQKYMTIKRGAVFTIKEIIHTHPINYSSFIPKEIELAKANEKGLQAFGAKYFDILKQYTII